MMNALVRRSWIFLPALAVVLAAPVRAQSVTLNPTSLSFAKQVLGTTSAPKSTTLKNSTSAAITITSIAVTGNFAESSTTCPLSPAKLNKGASCTIKVTFTPQALGTRTGNLTVTDTAGQQIASLSGPGVSAVTVAPTTLTFAKLPLGEVSPAQTVTVTNNQSVALSFTSIATTGDFAISATSCGTGIPAVSTCTVGVTFSPTATGARTGKLTFVDDAVNSPQSVTLNGTGGAAALLSITVTPANPSIFVTGTLQLTATGNYSNNTTKNLSSTVTWTTSPLGIASLSTGGLATGLAAGNTTVTAALGSVTGNTLLSVVQLFVPTGSLNTARYYHSATLLNFGLVLAAGGIGPIPGGTGAMGQLSSAELYNPGTGTFTFTGSLNTARDEHSATMLNNGTVLIAGGSDGNGELASAEIFNPATATFTLTTGSLNTARYEHTATILPDGTVLLAGGYGGSTVLASAELYNPATQTFTPTGNLNAARFGATATLLQNGTVLIAGGGDANGPLASAELYNPNTKLFTPTTGPLNTARSGATAVLLSTGQVLVTAGYNYLTTGPLTSAELYDPFGGTFSYTGSEGRTTWLGTATLLTNGTVLCAGSVYNATASEVYFPSSSTFTNNSALTTPRDLQTATLLPTGAVLMAGGYSSTVLSAAELYQPPTLAPLNLVSIAVTPFVPSIAVGASQQYIATGTFANNSTQQLASVTWSSANPAVATITNDSSNLGVAYGVAAGGTIISACTGTICGVLPLTVTGP